MADTAIAITAGTGTNIDTRTESTNSNHRQVIVVGDPSSNTGVAAVKDASTAPIATDPALVVSLSPNSAGIQATASHDAADTGDPLKIGFKATAGLSGLTPVAEGDRTNAFADLDGALFVRGAALGDTLSGVAAITDGSSTSVISAQGAGIKVYITDVIISNSSASAVTVDIRDGAAGTVKATFPAPATGGCVHRLATPIPFSANTAVCADPSASASTITVTLVGFKSKV